MIEGIILIETIEVHKLSIETAIGLTIICILIVAFAAINLWNANKNGWRSKVENTTWIVFALVAAGLTWNLYSQIEIHHKVYLDDNISAAQLDEAYEIVEHQGEEYVIKEKVE